MKYINAATAAEIISDKLNIPLNDLCDIVAEITSEDVQPVKHGRWINKGYYATCTLCGSSSGTQYDGVEPIPNSTSYCPNCGARMDGDRE